MTRGLLQARHREPALTTPTQLSLFAHGGAEGRARSPSDLVAPGGVVVLRPEVLARLGAQLAEGLRRDLLATIHALGWSSSGDIVVHDNRCSLFRIGEVATGRWRLRLHWHLATAHDEVDALLRHWVHHRSLPPHFRTWIRERMSSCPPDDNLAEVCVGERLGAQGVAHDLHEAVLAVLPRFPSETLVRCPAATWNGTLAGLDKRRALRLGVADLRSGRIRVHRCLDHPAVPGHVLRSVVHHELCHFVAPPLAPSEAAASREPRVHHGRFVWWCERDPELSLTRAWFSHELPRYLRAVATPTSGSRRQAR